MMLNTTNDRVVDYVSTSQVGLVGMTAGCEDSIDGVFSLCARLSKVLRPPVVLLGGAAVQSSVRQFPKACIRINTVEAALRLAERTVRR
jgi:hypothetical protein